MARYTLYRGDSAPIEDATEHILSAGAKVIASRPGLALIESTDAVAEHLHTVLKDWRISPEVTAKIPKPRPKMPREDLVYCYCDVPGKGV